MKKIAFIYKNFSFGGGEKVASLIVEQLCADATTCSDYQFYLFVSNLHNEKLRQVDSNNFTFLQLPGSLQSKVSAHYIVQQINQLGIDVLIMPSPPLHRLAWVRKHVPRCKIFYHDHSVPLRRVYDKMERADLHACRKGSRFSKLIKFIFCALPQKFFGVYTRAEIRKFRKLYSLVDCFIVLCDGYVEEYSKFLVGTSLSTNKLRVLYNPLEMFPQIEYNKRNEVLYMGRLTYADKRVDRLLRIWQKVECKFPDWKLKIVGDGPERMFLEALATKLNLQHVIFCGYSTDVAQYYQTAAVLCLTSAYEGWPLVLIEAQAMGVVPIAFDCAAGVRTIIGTDRSTGILVPPYDEQKFADELSAIMRNTTLRESMQQPMLQVVSAYRLEKIAIAWVKVFAELL